MHWMKPLPAKTRLLIALAWLALLAVAGFVAWRYARPATLVAAAETA